MEQIVFEQVIRPVVKFVTGHIKKHLGYAICSTDHVNKMVSKMKVLEDTSVDVRKHMDTNYINDKEIPTGVPSWLKDVEDLKKNVQSISSDDIGCLNIKKRYQAGRNASEATETTKELITKSYGFIWTDAPIPTGRVDSKAASSNTSTPSFLSSRGDVFKSRDRPFNDALKFLQQEDNKSQVIALCGMGGVGKTTMMEQLVRVVNEKKMFYLIVKVAIGRSPNMLSIQNDIALCLGGEGLREATEKARADGLLRRFKKILEDDKKKILVILDDVWEKIELKNIGLTSPLVGGVKLLLTSRDSNICTQIAVDASPALQVIRIDVLEEAEARDFFFQITGVSKEDDQDIYQIGCDIVKKCGYLPLAIKLIGATLKSQKRFAWRSTLQRLDNNNNIDKDVQEIIKISYEYIRKEEDKEIFLLCGLFPEDYDIPIEDLTRYAWGLKLLKDVFTLGDARDMTKTCVQNLINANLLIHCHDVRCVKMHDLVLAFVLGGISRGNHPWIINHGDISKWRRDDMSESCERVSLTCMSLTEFPIDFKYPNLSLLQLMHGDESLKFSEDFYENMRNLKVITYHRMQYPLLPRSLENLKTLCFHKCKLMLDFSIVGHLVNLEVLSFAHCGIRKLPSTVGNLSKLKLLDLTGCIDLHIDHGVFENLKNLEELYMRGSYYREAIVSKKSCWEELKMLSSKLCVLEAEFVEEMAQLKILYFNKLERFTISMGCTLGPEYNDKWSSRNTLKLVTDNKSDLLDCNIIELFKKTEILHLQVKDMICLENIITIPPYDQHSFCNLKELKVSACANLKYLFPISGVSGLRQLERLNISSCHVLKALVHKNVSEINSADEMFKFEKLKFLSLEELPELVCLFLVDNVIELPQLVELEVDGLPNFTSIYPDKNDIYALQRPFFDNKVRIPKLTRLTVEHMEKLKQIWPCEIGSSSEEEVKNMSMLKEIWVQQCDSLVNLFPTNPMRLLNHLKILSVMKCDSIKVIFNIDLECIGEVDDVLNSSFNIQVLELKNLRELWRIRGSENNKSSIRGFEAIGSIQIANCKSFRNVFTPTDAKFDMRAVVDISTDNCSESESNNDVSIEETPEVVGNIFNVAFPSCLIPTFPHQLSSLSLNYSERVKVVFEISNGESATTQDTQQQILLFPYLKHLDLSSMKRVTHVWKCDNWNKFIVPQKQHTQLLSFHNLTTITMSWCNSIEYLFSPLMAKLLSNLEYIDLYRCEGIEEVVSNRDDKDEEMNTSISTTNLFPHLNRLSFQILTNLKRIGGGGLHDECKLFQVGVVSWSLCEFPKEIHITSCHELSSVIPSYVVGKMQNLQVLTVTNCDSLTEVFETQEIDNINNNGGGDGSSNSNIHEENGGTGTITLAIPRLENINVPQLSSLKKLVISSCNLLQHVFTFSTLQSLIHLEELLIKECNALKVIVKKEIRKQRHVVVFPHLKSLELLNLPNLEGFFLGTNDFQWSLLEKVTISNCPKLMVFTYGRSIAPELMYIHTSIGKHSLECGLNFHLTTNLHKSWLPSSESTSLERLPWSFHNLIELHMESDHQVKGIIPFNGLLQLQKLERIRVFHCYSMHEIFEVEEAMEGKNSVSQTQTIVQIPNLRQMELEYLVRLKYIWKSKRTVVEFPNLTTLSIVACDSLEHVFTSSMVGRLSQLQHLRIFYSQFLEVIVKEEAESEFKCETIVLPCLKSLKLEWLTSLKGFSLGKDDFLWPSLHTLEITACPRITVFTKGHVATPALSVIDTNFGRCYLTEEEDINSFIKTKQLEGFQF